MSRSRSPSVSSSEPDDIEMSKLDDIIVTPDPRLNASKRFMDEEDEDYDPRDEGEVALLSGSATRRGGHERKLSYFVPPWWAQVNSIVLEAAPTLLLTTTGLLFTGELLDHVARWRAMRTVDELIMIIPVVLNLKGNLEMNLSARLSTAANTGELDDPKTRRKIIQGNLSLLQVQAVVVSFVAAIVTFTLSWLLPDLSRPTHEAEAVPGVNSTMLMTLANRHRPTRPLPLQPYINKPASGFAEFIMVASTAMSATCLSSIILGSFMCGLIVLCRRLGRDPDNIAPPIASCLGDLVTLVLIGFVSAFLITSINQPIPLILALLVVASSAFCLHLTLKNEHVKDLVKVGWSPLFGAMVISSATGLVLDVFASRYEGFPLLAIVISGLPGSVGSIFVSRLSTALHSAALLPHTSSSRSPAHPSPKLVMITLLLVTLPIEILFLATLHWLGWLRLPIVFALFSVFFFCCAVITSLFLARILTNFLWKRDLDPDMYALPYHSALMDLVGQLLLVLCFEIVSLLPLGLGAILKARPR